MWQMAGSQGEQRRRQQMEELKGRCSAAPSSFGRRNRVQDKAVSPQETVAHEPHNRTTAAQVAAMFGLRCRPHFRFVSAWQRFRARMEWHVALSLCGRRSRLAELMLKCALSTVTNSCLLPDTRLRTVA